MRNWINTQNSVYHYIPEPIFENPKERRTSRGGISTLFLLVPKYLQAIQIITRPHRKLYFVGGGRWVK